MASQTVTPEALLAASAKSSMARASVAVGAGLSCNVTSRVTLLDAHIWLLLCPRIGEHFVSRVKRFADHAVARRDASASPIIAADPQ